MHALIIFLILYPLATNDFTGEHAEGAGGPGPAGGGGGGSGGNAGGQRLQYVKLQPVPDAAAAVIPPKPIVPPKPVVTPPPAPTPQPAAPTAQPSATSTTPGTGTGNAGTAGAGPGTGGGVGSGIGTGTGSSVGPGTGGGPGGNYPPTPTQFFLPPLPAPPSVRGYHLIAWFDVDEKGVATLLGFNPSRDNSYNRKLRDVLLSLRFRPGVRPDGTPVRDTVDIQFIF